jgi:lon-related putative ATP-dependent protease
MSAAPLNDTAPEFGAASAARLAPAQLRRRCDAAKFPFATTAECPPLTEPLGQGRAVEAIHFGMGMRHEGFNLFAMGAEGIGRHHILIRLLRERAAREAVPSDWCYVFNFAEPHRPRALPLPAGMGASFKNDMQRLVEDFRAGIPAAYETDEYRARRHEIDAELNDRQGEAMSNVEREATAKGIALLRTPAGFGFVPRKDDGVMSPEEYHKLPEAEQKRIETEIGELQEALEKVFHDLPKWRRESHRKLKELNRQITRTAVNGLIEELRHKYATLPEVIGYLGAVQSEVIELADYFQQPREGEAPGPFGMTLPQPEDRDAPLKRFSVNLLVDRAGGEGAPVVLEDNPTHDALLGRIEHLAQMGMLKTDFTLIQAGALHRANGGYLVLDVLKIFTQPYAWEALKRSLRSRRVNIESVGQALGLVNTVSLEPQPIPLDVKVVLVGQRQHYYLLHQIDPEFGALFKVAVDFEDDVERDAATDLQFASVISSIVQTDQLRHLDREGIACVVENASRGAGDSEKLSVHMMELQNLLRESDYWAAQSGTALIGAQQVRQAIAALERRAGRVKERLREQVLRGTMLVDTTGARVGQINGLAVMQLGGFAFGMPNRITARVRLGSGRVVDIEREAQLGGPLHSKGVLILSGFLAGRYVTNRPLSLAASLVFEQSYGGVEGDSASSAELYALLSALADAPIHQSIAVTGSVNQHGDVQAIGGVNEKIEGFFDLCKARGLTGAQGVMIPASNVKHLMLKDEVVEAVSAGQFHIYAVKTIDEGIEILTSLPAGAPGDNGKYPEGSVNARVEARLEDFATRTRSSDAPSARRKRPAPGSRTR